MVRSTPQQPKGGKGIAPAEPADPRLAKLRQNADARRLKRQKLLDAMTLSYEESLSLYRAKRKRVPYASTNEDEDEDDCNPLVQHAVPSANNKRYKADPNCGTDSDDDNDNDDAARRALDPDGLLGDDNDTRTNALDPDAEADPYGLLGGDDNDAEADARAGLSTADGRVAINRVMPPPTLIRRATSDVDNCKEVALNPCSDGIWGVPDDCGTAAIDDPLDRDDNMDHLGGVDYP